MLALMVSRGSSMLIEGIEEIEGTAETMGKRHLLRVRRGGGIVAGLGWLHVEGIGGHQPHFAVRRAVADRGDGAA